MRLSLVDNQDFLRGSLLTLQQEQWRQADHQ